MKTLTKDPTYLVNIGLGGQGNVVLSTLICNALVREGYQVNFGQTFGPNQRGGLVLNFMSVSKKFSPSPMVPLGRADIIIALEPSEAIRMLGRYGNPDVVTVVDPKAIRGVDVAAGRRKYLDYNKVLENIKELSAKAWLINATEEARKLGDPRVANVIFIGAVVGLGKLPLDKESMEPVLRERFPRALEINLKALNRGMELVAA